MYYYKEIAMWSIRVIDCKWQSAHKDQRGNISVSFTLCICYKNTGSEKEHIKNNHFMCIQFTSSFIHIWWVFFARTLNMQKIQNTMKKIHWAKRKSWFFFFFCNQMVQDLCNFVVAAHLKLRQTWKNNTSSARLEACTTISRMSKFKYVRRHFIET